MKGVKPPPCVSAPRLRESPQGESGYDGPATGQISTSARTAATSHQARYLTEWIDAAPELELAAPVTLYVVCFRYIRPGLDAAALDALNKEILVEPQEQGIAAPSGTTIRGRYVLHVAHTNHRSRREDFDILVREVIRIGAEQARLSATANRV